MRYPSIDILRAVAVILMVVVHFIENLSGADWLPGGLAAPLFTFLAGVSYRLWVDVQETRGKTEDEISKASVRRGLFLFVLGFAFNILVWLPADMFNWDVLTLIGLSLLLLNLVRHLPPVVPAMLGAAALALGPILQIAVDYPAYWTNGYFECELTLPDVLIGFLAAGYFPLFPWVAFPLAGFVTGTAFFAGAPDDRPPTGWTALVGIALMGLSAAAVLAEHSASDLLQGTVAGGWSMFPATFEYLTGMLGLTLMLFALSHRWIDPRAAYFERARWFTVVRVFSKYSLSLYLFHHVVHIWPLWIYGAAVGVEPTEFWRNALSGWAAVALSILCLVTGFGLFRWMEKSGRGGIEGWMRHLCD